MTIRSSASEILRRAGLKRQAILALNAVGLGGGLRSDDVALDVDLFMRRSAAELRALTNGGKTTRVLLAGAFGSQLHHALTALLIAHALRLRGGDARVLQCDAALSACELTHAPMFPHIQGFIESAAPPRCPSCLGVTGKVFGHSRLPLCRLGASRSEDDYRLAWERTDRLGLTDLLTYRHDGLDLGEHVRTTLHRFFLSGVLPDDESTRLVARRFLATAVTLANALRRLFAEWRPDVVVAHHGIYLIGGVAVEVARREGIRVVAWDFAYRRHCLIASHGQTYHHELRDEPTSAWEDSLLTPAQSLQLDEYFGQRRLGKLGLDDVSYNAGNVTDRDRIVGQLGLDLSRRIVALFPNVIWDGRVSYGSPIYEGPVEWMVDTIRHLADRPNVQVVVRIHPAEVREKSWRGLQRVEDEIRRALPVLPPNVVLIAPEARVNSYALAELAHACAVFATKLGLELLLMRKPVIIIGDSFYGYKRFGMQPTSREEYLRLLDNLDAIHAPDEQQMDRIRRYAYHYFFRRQIQIPFFYRSVDGAPVAGSLSDLLPGKSEGLDRLCEGILRGRPFHLGATC